ncbi:MAG TPA: YfhO family protein [Verrucomicrobiae bacterium]|nr:YfhO family protein [Verrucomicrobiae bacterium]
MSETTGHRAFNWFTPGRFALLLALLVFAAFPQVILGLQTFVVRDYGFFAYPLAHFQRECFWRGELPFWDPYNNCGTPFLAQWNTMPLYPPALIYLILPLGWSLSFFCLLHLWFGGFGMYHLARRWTGSDIAAAFAGVAFPFSGLTLNLLMWPSHIATFSWLPWVILLVERAWREGGRTIVIASLAGAMQMLAGGPETIFLTWLLLAALWIQQVACGVWQAKHDAGLASAVARHTSVLWRFPALVLLVAALAALQLLPFLELAAHSGRHGSFADFRWSMPAWGWMNFLVPMVFGNLREMGVFFQYNQGWTSSYYVGMGALWLALLAAWTVRDRRVTLLAVAGILALIFALGENTFVYPALRRLIPQLSLITYPVKFVLATTFLAPLLAAYALAKMQTPEDRKQNISRRLIFSGATLLALIVGILVWAWRFPLPGDDVHATLVNGLTRAAFLVLTGALLLVLLSQNRETKWRRFVPLLLVVVVWLDVMTHEPAQNPTASPGIYQLNLARTKLDMNPQPELGRSRVMLTPAAFFAFVHTALPSPKDNFLIGRLAYGADCNLLDNVPKVDGFLSLTPRECDNFQTLIYGSTNANYPHLNDFMGVSQITAPDQIYHWRARTNFLPLVTAGQKPIFLPDTTTLRLLTAPDFDPGKMVFLPPEAQRFVTVTNQTAARVLDSHFGIQTVDADVEADDPSLVVVSQTYYHNWRAFVDGRPVPLLRANEAFQAVQVPAGRHHVHLVYEDSAFRMGAMISLSALLVCALAWFLLPRRDLK